MHMRDTIQDWLSQIDSRTRHRGIHYYRKGHVLGWETVQNEIVGSVRGSLSKPYTVRLIRDADGIITRCSCPVGVACKHAVALAIALTQEKKQETTITPSQSLSLQEQAWLTSLQVENERSEPSKKSFIVYGIHLSHINSPIASTVQVYETTYLKNGKDIKVPSHGSFLDRRYSIVSFTKSHLQEVDREIISGLLQSQYFPIEDEVNFLQKLVNSGRCFLGKPSKSTALHWSDNKPGSFQWEYNSQQKMTPILQIEDTKTISCWLWNKTAFYIDPKNLLVGLVDLPAPIDKTKAFLAAPSIPLEKAKLLQTELNKIAPYLPPVLQNHVSLPATTPIFCAAVKIKENPTWSPPSVIVTLSVKYGDHKLSEDIGEQFVYTFQKDHCIYQLPRNREKERDAVRALYQLGWDINGKNIFSYSADRNTNYVAFFALKLNELRELGWEIEGKDHKVLRTKVVSNPEWYGHVSEGENDWFDLEIGSIIDGKRVNLSEIVPGLLEQFRREEGSFQKICFSTKEGDILIVPSERIKMLMDTFLHLLNPEVKRGKIAVSKAMIPSLAQASDKLLWEMPQRYIDLQNKLSHLQGLQPVVPPQSFLCELRPYQLHGLSWLQFLVNAELGGILADDMGLGKTIQTLAHILLEKEKGAMTKPALIVAPTSLMTNWLQEAKKFAPSLSVMILQGSHRKGYFEAIRQHDIVLTTYPLLVRDEEELLKHEFYFLILDEAQMIKNAKTKAHHVLQKIRAKHKICLTGTPMENHLGELWSLFHILLPGFLGTEKQFQSIFRRPIEKENSLDRRTFLQKRIQPFFLRRTKEEVVLDLPPKTEIVIPIELTKTQKDLYEAVRLTMMEKVLTHVEEKGLAKSRIVLLDALLKLRQICCDPRLLKNTPHAADKKDSAKLTYLSEILPQMIEEKRQILLFSQFTSMLDLIQIELKELSIPYVILTGDTTDRATPIQEFQSGKVPLFLISLKAGGTGLNLTAADTVIHYDPWWNPSVENQATARAHRIGQKKSVFVYKWISSGGIEEKILQLQEKKKILVSGLLEGKENQMVDLSAEDIYELFAPIHEVALK